MKQSHQTWAQPMPTSSFSLRRDTIGGQEDTIAYERTSHSANKKKKKPRNSIRV